MAPKYSFRASVGDEAIEVSSGRFAMIATGVRSGEVLFGAVSALSSDMSASGALRLSKSRSGLQSPAVRSSTDSSARLSGPFTPVGVPVVGRPELPSTLTIESLDNGSVQIGVAASSLANSPMGDHGLVPSKYTVQFASTEARRLEV